MDATADNAEKVDSFPVDKNIEVACCDGTLITDRYDKYRSRFLFVRSKSGEPVQFTLSWPDGKQTIHSIMNSRTVMTGRSFDVAGCKPATHQGRPSALHNIEVERTSNSGEGNLISLASGYAGNYVLATFRIRDLIHPGVPTETDHSVVIAPGSKIPVALEIPGKWDFLGLVNATYDPDPVSDIWLPDWICPRTTGHGFTPRLMIPSCADTRVVSDISARYEDAPRCNARKRWPGCVPPSSHRAWA